MTDVAATLIMSLVEAAQATVAPSYSCCRFVQSTSYRDLPSCTRLLHHANGDTLVEYFD
jgi:hypothetical protein